MARRSRGLAATLALIAILIPSAHPSTASAGSSPFTDIAGTTFEADIEWLFAEGITVGCTASRYCPNDPVTRGEMASFLVRMFDFADGGDIDAFTDDDGTTHESAINAIAHAKVTKGCTATTFCPAALVDRGEMASFLARAIPLTIGAGNDYFRDDNGTTHEANVNRAAAAGIASGCGAWHFCPTHAVTRGEMAGFLHRVEQPIPTPPYPAPSGPLTLHVAVTGSDAGNDCLDETDPCRTIRYAIALALDDDTISLGSGTFAEENLTIASSLTITGDPDGGTVIDAGGGGRYRIFTIPDDREVEVVLRHLTLTGGRADTGGAIRLESNSLTIIDSTIRENAAAWGGGGIWAMGYLGLLAGRTVKLTIVDSAIHGNSSDHDAGGVLADGVLAVKGSTFSGNYAQFYGGGLYAYGGFREANSMSFADSTFSANVAGAGGGAIYAPPLNVGVNLTLTNSTISGNSARWTGGIRSFVEYHIPPTTVYLANTVIAGNDHGDVLDVSVGAKVASIIGIPAGISLADILDPAGLADNGGPTQTIALTDSATNPAVGTGDAATCASAPVDGLDQRGLPRTAPCDIGAYEIQP